MAAKFHTVRKSLLIVGLLEFGFTDHRSVGLVVQLMLYPSCWHQSHTKHVFTKNQHG